MKILKALLGIIIVFLLIVLVLSFIGPNDYRVERSKVMNAPADVVYNQFGQFAHWDAWSPWKEKDPNMKFKVEGADGTVGAKYSWFGGNPDITGTGSMTIKEATPGKKLMYDLAFTEPWEMQSEGGFEIESIDSMQSKVTWFDQGDIPFSQRAMMNFMNLDDMMGPDFERGLNKMDSMAQIELGAKLVVPVTETE